MNTSLPPVGNYEQSPNRLRLDLLEQLHWDVFGPLGDIQVKVENNILTPFSGHRIASESLPSPPFTNIEVNIDRCTQKAALDETDEDEDPYEAPEPLVIDKEDGSSISLHDFVAQVHEYLNANKEELCKCEDEMYMNPVALGDGQQAVEVIPDGGEGVPDDDEDASGSDDESLERNHFLKKAAISLKEFGFFLIMLCLTRLTQTNIRFISLCLLRGIPMGLSLEKILARKTGP